MEVKFQLALRRNCNCRYHRTLSFRKHALIFPVSLKTLPHSGLTEVSLCTSIQGWERNDSLHLLNLSRQESHTRCLLTARHPSSAAGWGTHSWPSPHYGQSFPEDFPPGSAPRCPSSPSKSRQTSAKAPPACPNHVLLPMGTRWGAQPAAGMSLQESNPPITGVLSSFW